MWSVFLRFLHPPHQSSLFTLLLMRGGGGSIQVVYMTAWRELQQINLSVLICKNGIQIFCLWRMRVLDQDLRSPPADLPVEDAVCSYRWRGAHAAAPAWRQWEEPPLRPAGRSQWRGWRLGSQHPTYCQRCAGPNYELETVTSGEHQDQRQWVKILWDTVLEYFCLMLLYTSTLLHFRGKYCSFYLTTFIWQL